MVNFQPLAYFTVLLYRIVDWIFKIIPVKNEGGGQMGKNTFALGGGVVVASVHVRTKDGGGQTFAILVRWY